MFSRSLALIALGAISLTTLRPAFAQTLTDITLFRIDGANNTVNEGFNTRGGDFISNLYLLSGGSFVNSGNAGATSIAINLSAPGSYTFTFAGENVNTNVGTALGINFFFNGGATTPDLSARGTAVTNNAGGFVANGGSSSRPDFTTVAGANALSFVSGTNLVTLSAFSYVTNSNADQVTSFNNAPGGTNDTVGSFTLRVTGTAAAAPEPSALALCVLPFIGGVARLRAARR